VVHEKIKQLIAGLQSMNSYFHSIEFQNGKATRLFHHRQPQPRIFFRANQKKNFTKKSIAKLKHKKYL